MTISINRPKSRNQTPLPIFYRLPIFRAREISHTRKLSYPQSVHIGGGTAAGDLGGLGKRANVHCQYCNTRFYQKSGSVPFSSGIGGGELSTGGCWVGSLSGRSE